MSFRWQPTPGAESSTIHSASAGPKSPPPTTPALQAAILGLQRVAGNRAVQSAVQRFTKDRFGIPHPAGKPESDAFKEDPIGWRYNQLQGAELGEMFLRILESTSAFGLVEGIPAREKLFGGQKTTFELTNISGATVAHLNIKEPWQIHVAKEHSIKTNAASAAHELKHQQQVAHYRRAGVDKDATMSDEERAALEPPAKTVGYGVARDLAGVELEKETEASITAAARPRSEVLAEAEFIRSKSKTAAEHFDVVYRAYHLNYAFDNPLLKLSFGKWLTLAGNEQRYKAMIETQQAASEALPRGPDEFVPARATAASSSEEFRKAHRDWHDALYGAWLQIHPKDSQEWISKQRLPEPDDLRPRLAAPLYARKHLGVGLSAAMGIELREIAKDAASKLKEKAGAKPVDPSGDWGQQARGLGLGEPALGLVDAFYLVSRTPEGRRAQAVKTTALWPEFQRLTKLLIEGGLALDIDDLKPGWSTATIEAKTDLLAAALDDRWGRVANYMKSQLPDEG